MSDVVIVTFINSYNYGAFLQAKATEELVRQMGYKPIFLNYCNSEEESQRKAISFSYKDSLAFNLKRVLYKLWYGYYHGEIINGRKNFQKSINDLPKTKKYRNLLEIEKDTKIDVLLCGSDQIWNPEICQGVLDPIYFGGINSAGKKISFASSFGSFMPDENESRIIRNYFLDFSAIAVREQLAQKVISSLIPERKVEVVLDPTLCLSSGMWRKLIQYDHKYFDNKDNYAVVYLVNPKVNCQPLIDYVKEKLKLKIVWIKNNNLKRLMVDQIITNATPYDFISLIAGAKFVLTDSFHGTAFSVNFNIDFASIINSKNPERARHLCERLGLMNRLVNECGTVCNVNKIDYAPVNNRLDELRSTSIDWLKVALQS